MSDNLLQQVRDQGVSPWLDGVTRDELRSGAFQALIDNFGVSGMTANPSLFAKSLVGSVAPYEDGIRDLATRGVGPEEAARLLAAQDAREACDILRATHEVSGGYDGWVCLGVDPRFVDDVEATLADVRTLAWLVDRPNLMIEIPATLAGLSAIATATAEGYNINATLILSVERYRAVLDAYARGLERAAESRIKLADIYSVASVCVSRTDALLALRRSDQAQRNVSGGALCGVANARDAYRVLSEAMRTDLWHKLLAVGANPQRLLWESTRVKDLTVDETTYLVGLDFPGTICAMGLETLASAVQTPSQPMSVGMVTGDVVRACDGLGVIQEAQMPRLLEDGVAREQKSWRAAVTIVDERLDAARSYRPTEKPAPSVVETVGAGQTRTRWCKRVLHPRR